jgi:hypothetical protein
MQKKEEEEIKRNIEGICLSWEIFFQNYHFLLLLLLFVPSDFIYLNVTDLLSLLRINFLLYKIHLFFFLKIIRK